MTASNGARKSSKSSPSTPRNGYPTPNLGPTTPTRTLSGNSATPPNGYPGPNLGRPTPTRPLSGNPPAAGGGFDKLLGLATRGTPIVGSRSNNIGSQVLRNPSNPNGPENLGKGDEVPAPNYDALPALRGIPAVGSEIAFKVLEMSDDYSPGLSEYKVGAVVAVGERGDVTVEVVNSGTKKRRRNGKFELNDDEDDDAAEVGSAKETMSYNWAEMH